MPDIWRVVPIFLFVFYMLLAITPPLLIKKLPKNTINLVETTTKIVFNAAAAVAGVWAIYTYRRSKRADASKWIYNLFNEFYTDEKYYWSRDTFEYSYPLKIAPLLELRVTDRQVKLSSGQIEDLRNIDLLLNFFEHLLYLEEENIIVRRDREVFFEYWFGFFSYPQRGGLRRYFAKCGYERLAEYSKAHYKEYVAVPIKEFAIIQQYLKKNNKLKISKLETVHVEEFTDYGKIVEGKFISFQLERLNDIHILDKLLIYKPDDRNQSVFLRKALRVNPINKDCWVYFKKEFWRDDYDS